MIIRHDFIDTSPYYIHPSAPAPLGDEAGAHHEARMLEPGAIIDDEQAERMAENEAARQAGKRMTDQEVGEAWANIVTPIVFAIVVVAAVWHVVAGGA